MTFTKLFIMKKQKKTRIEQFVIDKVKEIRIEKGISQEEIALYLETTKGFIGQIETPNHSSKYNINHLNTIAVEFNCSIKDFFPDLPFPDEEKI